VSIITLQYVTVILSLFLSPCVYLLHSRQENIILAGDV